MPPFHQLFTSAEFWSAVILALLGGGGVGGLVGAWSSRRKDSADIDRIAAETSQKIQETYGRTVDSMRDQLDFQERQIQHLEAMQRKYFTAAAYIRRLFHWLQSFCEVVEPEFLVRHPKPSLPDELRPDVAPETIIRSETKEQT